MSLEFLQALYRQLLNVRSGSASQPQQLGGSPCWTDLALYINDQVAALLTDLRHAEEKVCIGVRCMKILFKSSVYKTPSYVLCSNWTLYINHKSELVPFCKWYILSRFTSWRQNWRIKTDSCSRWKRPTKNSWPNCQALLMVGHKNGSNRRPRWKNITCSSCPRYTRGRR